MKIIDTDNFGGDYPDEKVVADNIPNTTWGREAGEVMADALNAKWCNRPDARRFYRVVEDDYKLQPGFEP